MLETLEYLIRALVEEPDKVRVEAREDGGCIVYDVIVAPEDVGRVIGKGGKTINALRTIVRAADAPRGLRAEVEVTD